MNGVISDLVIRTNYFYDIDKSKFTVGIFLTEVATKDESLSAIYRHPKNFTFRDDLNLVDIIPEDLASYETNSDSKFKILTTFHESIGFERFIQKKINNNGISYTLICSPIPNVCESCPPIGVIYTIYEGEENCSIDSSNILLINGRILSNWISKYEDCLYKSTNNPKEIPIHEHKEIIIPEEIKKMNN